MLLESESLATARLLFHDADAPVALYEGRQWVVEFRQQLRKTTRELLYVLALAQIRSYEETVGGGEPECSELSSFGQLAK